MSTWKMSLILANVWAASISSTYHDGIAIVATVIFLVLTLKFISEGGK